MEENEHYSLKEELEKTLAGEAAEAFRDRDSVEEKAEGSRDKAPGLSLQEEIEREDALSLQEEEDLLEALLFSLGRTVSLEEMAICLHMGVDGAELAAERLRKKYEERQGGLLIRKLEGKYQMVSHPKTYDALIRVVKQSRKPVLSDVHLETLSIIAYCQPVTKAEVERIRGVKSVNRLVEFGLIEEVGRLDAPGRPVLFGTTEEFLTRFGVDSLASLPSLPKDLEKLLEEEVTEELKDSLGLEPEKVEEAKEERLEDQKEELNEEPEEVTDEAEESTEPEDAVEEETPEPEFSAESEEEKELEEAADEAEVEAEETVEETAEESTEGQEDAKALDPEQ